MFKKSFVLLLFIFLIGCGQSEKESDKNLTVSQIGERYVKLILRIGQFDSDFVDAYYGPENLKPIPISDNQKRDLPSDEFVWEIHHLIHLLEDIDDAKFDELDKAHKTFLMKQLMAAKIKVSMLGGSKLKFDEESKMLYDAIAPHHSEEYFDSLLTELDLALPGDGSIQARYKSFTDNFIIPKTKIDEVFRIAIAEARRRTGNKLELPLEENFELEYVTDKSWSGYNWYQGGYRSIIQINTDFPVYVDRVIDLASHEGYPGHHVYNMMLEKHLVHDKGWVDFSVYPLFSPQSLIAEGSANFGIEMVFPEKERVEFEKSVIYPLAGLDSSQAELYAHIQMLRGKLDYAGNEAARNYLNGEITREEAAAWLEKYNFSSQERALQRTRFFDQYRSYVINYNLGRDLVKDYVIKKSGEDLEKRWEVFEELLSTPKTASMLKN